MGSRVQHQQSYQRPKLVAMALLMRTLGTMRVWARKSPVTGEVKLCSSQASRAALSYVCPSAAITGSTISACKECTCQRAFCALTMSMACCCSSMNWEVLMD